jgi:uncharacterized protein involved in tolerance to divalent cations
MTEYIQVFTTIVGRDAAQKLADVVLGQRLAACVQIAGPIHLPRSQQAVW